MLFKKSNKTAPGATPATPKIGSIALPIFGAKGYESDSFTKSTAPTRRIPLPDKPTAGRSTPMGTSTSRMKEVYTLPEESFRPRRDSTSTSSVSKPSLSSLSRSRTSSNASPTPPGWGGTPIAIPKSKTADNQWASSSSQSSWGESCLAERMRSQDHTRSRSNSLSNSKPPCSASYASSNGGSSAKMKLKELKPVNVSTVPMKQEPPTSVHWQLIPYILRKHHCHPPLLLDLASDITNNKDNLCFLNTYPRRPLVHRDLDKTACDVETMIIACDELPKWANWHVVIHASKVDNRIRCGHVFEAIHRTFNQRLTEGELALLNGKERRVCEEAFEARCAQSSGLTAWNKKQGMKRVDMLRGKTFFNGLTFDEKRSIWLLHLTRTPVV